MTPKGLSGFNWDDEKGMNIGIGEADAWKAYITVCCIMILSDCTTDLVAETDGVKMYTNKGFLLYHMMTLLMPSLGKGTHAFQPSDQT